MTDDAGADAFDEALDEAVGVELVDERFTARRVVARGRNAWVLQAEHGETERVVALKVAFPDARSRARLRGEAKVLGALAHVGVVVSVLDARFDDQASYLALEWIRGRSLEGILTARGTLSEDTVLALAEPLADALAEVHDAGHVHGDLAPKHVIVTRDRHGREGVKLIDFGASTVTPPVDRPPDAWTAPEVLGARHRTTASDVFALASVLGCCLVGRTVRGRDELPKTGVGELLAYALSPTADDRPPAAVVLRELGRLRGRRGPDGAPQAGEARRPSVHAGPAGAELRRKPRAGYVTPVRVTRGGAAFDGRSEDVSEGGMMLVLREPCVAGETIGLRFALPLDGRVVSCSARVAWSRSHLPGLHAVGVELVDPRDAVVSAIAQYIELMGFGR